MTDTPEPKTPGDVFTRVLTENIGNTVYMNDGREHSRNTIGKVVAVEAGVVTIATTHLGLFEGQEDTESLSYHRIDKLAYVSPSTLDRN